MGSERSTPTDIQNSDEGTEKTGQTNSEIVQPLNRREYLRATALLGVAGGISTKSGTATDGTQGDAENEGAQTFLGAGKNRPTYYRPSERTAAIKNTKKYDWAKSMKEDAVEDADRLLSAFNLDQLWKYVGSQNIPRATWLAGGNAGYGMSSSEWEQKKPLLRYVATPGTQWKITNGKYTLPTNDFEKYRRSGLDNKGCFDPAKANDSLLKNKEHPEKGEQWGVDNGTGWVDENGDLGPEGQRWVPVAWAHHWTVVYGYREMLSTLFHAFLYTEKTKYARAAAVILDRVGDVYPEFSLQDTVQFDSGGYTKANGLPNPSHGGTGKGKQMGSIWAAYWVKEVLRAYDAIWPGMKSDKLVSFLESKSSEYSGLRSKSSIGKIRSNIEKGLVKEILPATKSAQLRGNFGIHQTTLAMAAVIQDDPNGYSGDVLDFLFSSGGLEHSDGEYEVTGGAVRPTLLDTFDRDGFPYEGSIHYNSVVQNAIQNVATTLEEYPPYRKKASGKAASAKWIDLTENPIYKQMSMHQGSLVFMNSFVPRLGDTESSGDAGFEPMLDVNALLDAYRTYGEDELAQWIHLRNGKSTDGLRTNVFDSNPKELSNRIETVIEKKGPLDTGSTQLAGFGFTALRSGGSGKGRGVYTYYGRNGYGPDQGYGTSHCHRDTLNIGLFAHDMNLSPDLGYPEETSDWPKRWNWTSNTISHNTVVVNENPQKKQWVSKPKGFDHTERVQLFDVDASQIYPVVDEYRRTVAQISVDENNSYVVDFFRVDGGSDHHYSFHGAQLPSGSMSAADGQGANTDGGSEFVIRDGGGQIRSISGGGIVITDGEMADQRGMTVSTDADSVKTTISASLDGSHAWPINQSIYLGRNADGPVCAGIGRPTVDETPRYGIYYPKREEWGEYEEIAPSPNELAAAGFQQPPYGTRDEDNRAELSAAHADSEFQSAGDPIAAAWERSDSLGLQVSTDDSEVHLTIVDDGTKLAERTFDLQSTTNNHVGIFGATGANQTGQLRFGEFSVDGETRTFFSVAAQSPNTMGLSLSPQNKGTYAGKSVKKPDHGENTAYNKNNGNGFNYLYNVKRDRKPKPSFGIDWRLADHWDTRSNSKEPVHLRLTMLEDVDDVALANGDPPQRWENPETYPYFIAHRSGKDLRTTFTSVIEPYTKNRFVKSISRVPIKGGGGSDRAVKVKLKNGRTDWIASAANQEKRHNVGTAFEFRGRFAIYSENGGKPVFAYLFDGTQLKSNSANSPQIKVSSGRIEGTVKSFTNGLSSENTIDIEVNNGLDRNRSLSDLNGEWIYADSDSDRNGAYRITDVSKMGNRRATLTVDSTTVKGTGGSGGDSYDYVLKSGGSFVVPLGETWSG